ncbi:SpoIVB peptidase [Anaeromassilibacillus senegalensis]|uniref:SpoIVB peptidase n=1 Tax=Anaeromassilibacillus senegalensis TaxID=1673717 RepID=UPI000681DA47|nr:SpoIVB peptidase [Anaeromassilibacillus senegalensis]
MDTEKKRWKTRTKAAVAAVITAAAVVTTSAGVARYFTPDQYSVTRGNSLEWNSGMVSLRGLQDGGEVCAGTSTAPENYRAELMLFHSIPIKTVQVKVMEETNVVLCGRPFGIKMFTNGVMVVGVADIQGETATVNPAAVAGLKTGDIITEVNGHAVNRNEEVAKAVEESAGQPLQISFQREHESQTATLVPVRSKLDGSYKAGLWVRDSTAGIGTLTFYDPATNSFAGLGHGICDTDTTELMPLRNGEIVPVTINGVVKGKKGAPGELRGYFNTDVPMGTLYANSDQGVYGQLKDGSAQEQGLVGDTVCVAMKQEVKTGPVQILATIDGGEAKYYNASIENINYHDTESSKNMILKITDPELLNETGGIVQGMSGSPIIQNGKLIGAVTHVFVNDPTRGYGIFAENMLGVCQTVEETLQRQSA